MAAPTATPWPTPLIVLLEEVYCLDSSDLSDKPPYRLKAMGVPSWLAHLVPQVNPLQNEAQLDSEMKNLRDLEAGDHLLEQ